MISETVFFWALFLPSTLLGIWGGFSIKASMTFQRSIAGVAICLTIIAYSYLKAGSFPTGGNTFIPYFDMRVSSPAFFAGYLGLVISLVGLCRLALDKRERGLESNSD